ncbi:ZIP family metal transporter [Marinobacter litoralis]|uniref:ZIP family metal transporter n=1 Tax=Marinobacter litoralis TaxID=187981 RepID=UPI0018EAA38A|nr:divalent cation transporter [Marinobacter litoralis]MBJ6137083.1 divalent cation transporter [Marinobacter litoralis]
MVEAIQANGLLQLVLLTLMAGAAMPLGAALASVERIHPDWLESELHHSVIAFGGGALLAAVALVLVPEGTANLAIPAVVVCFAAGGITFMLVDRWLAANGTSASQLVAMLTDFVPEALALGATFSVSSEGGILLAGIIALQNLPEGFNSYRELTRSTDYGRLKIVGGFALMALLGPVAGATGHYFLSDSHQLVSGIMLFAAGGILYIIFQDIAPQSRLEKHWGPPLGAVAGFLLGLIGSMMLSG